MPRFTQEDLDEEILNLWNATVKSEQPDALDILLGLPQADKQLTNNE